MMVAQLLVNSEALSANSVVMMLYLYGTDFAAHYPLYRGTVLQTATAYHWQTCTALHLHLPSGVQGYIQDRCGRARRVLRSAKQRSAAVDTAGAGISPPSKREATGEDAEKDDPCRSTRPPNDARNHRVPWASRGGGSRPGRGAGSGGCGTSERECGTVGSPVGVCETRRRDAGSMRSQTGRTALTRAGNCRLQLALTRS